MLERIKSLLRDYVAPVRSRVALASAFGITFLRLPEPWGPPLATLAFALTFVLGIMRPALRGLLFLLNLPLVAGLLPRLLGDGLQVHTALALYFLFYVVLEAVAFIDEAFYV